MKKMYRVRIKQSVMIMTGWYKDEIGKEFIVEDYDNNFWNLVENSWYCISKEDTKIICEVVQKIVYEDVKPKVKKYKVLYKSHINNDYCVTDGYYKDASNFYSIGMDKDEATFIQLIEGSMIEVDG